jgi:hypothetical protein
MHSKYHVYKYIEKETNYPEGYDSSKFSLIEVIPINHEIWGYSKHIDAFQGFQESLGINLAHAD